MLDIPALIQLLPNLPYMMPLTALCFIFSGGALLILTRRQLHANWLVVVRGIALLLGVCGGVTLLQYVTIPPLPMPDGVQLSNPSLYWMSFGAALGFVLVALALLLLTLPRYHILSFVPALMLGFIGGLVAMTYLFDIRALLSFELLLLLSPQTATGFVVLSVGLQFVYPSQLLPRLLLNSQTSHAARGVAGLLLLVPFGVGWLIEWAETTELSRNPVQLALLIGMAVVVLSSSTLWNIYALQSAQTLRQIAQDHVQYQTQLLENAGDAIIGTDPQFNIIYWNRAAEQLYGWKATETFGKSISTTVSTIFLNEETQYRSAERLRQQGSWQGEVIQHTRQGTELHMLSSVTMMRDLKGNPIGVVAVNRDITQRVQLGLQLAEAQKQRQAMLKELEMERLKDQFLAMATHDFRNPLAVIMMSIDVMDRYLDRLTVEQVLQATNRVRDQVIYLRGLLDSLTMLRQTQEGELVCVPQIFELATFLRNLRAQITGIDGQKHHILFEETNINHVKLDPQLVRRILDNLLSNALKYSPNGTTVTFSVRRDTPMLMFTIIDQGIGIPEAEQDRIFNIFERASNAVNAKISGSGLGLAIVQECVRVHGGKITMTSAEGRGTTFIVQLPDALIETDEAITTETDTTPNHPVPNQSPS
ncbi:MAG: PAS domain-containing sensor histidine kinase [Armatimonadetes bacterium]|nr:PAS domain-containing sensor histidine kinase [Anaerolineae bacterium]